MKNKFVIYFVALYLASSGALEDARSARILDYAFDNTGTGPYNFRFETSDGTKREEEGKLINANTENEALIVKGSYSYIGPDGVTYEVRYVADENGFHPEGDHIKVPPFVPWVKHGNHQSGGHSLEQDSGSNSKTQIYLPPSSSRPLPTQKYIPSTPQPPATYIPSRPSRPAKTYIPSTPRPQFGQQPASSNIAAREVNVNELDPKTRESILTVLTRGGARELSIDSINQALA